MVYLTSQETATWFSSLHSCQQCVSSSCSISTLILGIAFYFSLSSDVKWYLIVVSTFVSLMANDVEYLFMVLIHVSSFMECLFKSFAHFQKVRLFILSYKRPLYILDPSFFFPNIFSPSLICLF